MWDKSVLSKVNIVGWGIVVSLFLFSGTVFGQEQGEQEALRTFKAAPSYFIGNSTHSKTGKKLVTDDEVVAFVQTQKGRVLFTPSGAYIGMGVPTDDPFRERPLDRAEKRPFDDAPDHAVKTVVLKAGCSANHAKKRAIVPRLEEPTQHIVSFMLGAKENWQTGLKTYKKLVYDDVWEGITLEYLGYQDRLEYRLILAPHADPSQILMETGAERFQVLESGALLTHLDGATLRLGKPIAYQLVDGTRKDVRVDYELRDNGQFGFVLGDYNSRLPLIIDPELIWSTYLGDSEYDRGYGVAVDVSGNAYVTGDTRSSGFPTTSGVYDETWNGGYGDVFVSKLGNSGLDMSYSTFLGASESESGVGIAVDGAGNAYVTGVSGSVGFPSTNGAFDETHNGSSDVFVSKLNNSGTDLIYSTFLGGSGSDVGYGIAVDGYGNAYVTGHTQSGDFPTTSGAHDETHNGTFAGDGFVSKLNSSGADLSYATFLGGSTYDYGAGIAVDGSGNAYVIGYTNSSDFPTTSGTYDETHNGDRDVFVSKLNNGGTVLTYSTFLGNSESETGMGIAVDADGNAYVTGYTDSSGFPTTSGAYDETLNDSRDVFLCKLNVSGTDLIFSTFLGGSGQDYGYGIVLNDSGEAYVTGKTWSSDFPATIGAFGETPNGSFDVFFSKFNNSGTDLSYSTFLGGSEYDCGNGIALHGPSKVFITGYTESGGFPTTSGVFDETFNGDEDTFVACLDLSCFPGPVASVSGDAGICLGDGTTIEAALSGTPPWDVTWSDGMTQTGLMTSPATRVVSPTSTTVYTVTVFDDADCSGSGSGSATVTVDSAAPAQPGTITGDVEVCSDESGSAYGIETVPDATEYLWTVPTGATIASGQGTGSIAVDFGSNSGDVSVTASNACGTSVAQTLAVTVHSRPTATVTGDVSICVGDATAVQAALTGTGPWDVTWSDGVVQSGVQTSPASRLVSPVSTTVYAVTSVTDSLCSDVGTGIATVTVNALPTAAVSGGATICEGQVTSVHVDLTGDAPWDVTWSDSANYPNVTETPLVHNVSPDVTTVYTVTSVDDSNCSGTPSGEATVTVEYLDVLTDPHRCVAQGIAYQIFEAFPLCDAPPTEFEWTIPATGYSFGLDVNPVTINPIPADTTDYQIQITDQATRATITSMLRLLVAVDTSYFDYFADGCNDLDDLFLLCADWRGLFPSLDDPNGDGIVDVLDYLYINLDDIGGCVPTNVFIPDPVFKQYLVANFDTNMDDEISYDEALVVTSIDTPGSYGSQGTITDLTGIQAFLNLQTLICQAEQLAVIPDISALTQLEYIDCGGNLLALMPDLSTLSGLRFLYCGWNDITEIPGLGSANLLEFFNCYSNEISNFPDLSVFPNLRSFSCGYNQLSDLDGLSSATQLYYLYVAGNPVGNLPDLSPLTGLQQLLAGNNGMTVFPNVSSLTSLAKISIWDDAFDTIPDLSLLTSLNELSVTGTEITDLPDLSSLSSLQTLNCSSNLMLDPPDVSANLNLDSLNCSGNYFDAGDCAAIAVIEAMGLTTFIWNPQYDGSTLVCTD